MQNNKKILRLAISLTILLSSNPLNILAYEKDNNILNVNKSIPNDLFINEQWSFNNTNTFGAWGEIQKASSDIVIAILDTGVDSNHPDLKDSMVKGYNTLEDTYDTEDLNGHGTHVAGIAAAIRNNGIGIAGVASGAKIMPIKVLGNTGLGSSSSVAKGIRYAVDHYKEVGGKRLIINMSIQIKGYNDPAVQEALNYAYENNAVLVASMGNSGDNTIFYPAAVDKVIAVGNVDEYDNKNYMSSYGEHIDVSAPGTNILSTLPGGEYGYDSGTSMSAPFVSGQASLILSKSPELSVDQVASIIKKTAKDIDAPGFDIYTGYGIVDVYNSISYKGDTAEINKEVIEEKEKSEEINNEFKEEDMLNESKDVEQNAYIENVAPHIENNKISMENRNVKETDYNDEKIEILDKEKDNIENVENTDDDSHIEIKEKEKENNNKDLASSDDKLKDNKNNSDELKDISVDDEYKIGLLYKAKNSGYIIIPLIILLCIFIIYKLRK